MWFQAVLTKNIHHKPPLWRKPTGNLMKTFPPLTDASQIQRLGGHCGFDTLLAIQSSTPDASLAVCRGDAITCQIRLDRQSRTAASITGLISQLIDDIETAGGRVDVIAVTDGPGSFTGLRIGVTTAKALAYALGCPTIAVDSLAAMAYPIWRSRDDAMVVTVAMNAYRGQVFTASWTRDQWDGATNVTGDFSSQSRVIDEKTFEDELSDRPPTHVLVCDPGITKYDADVRLSPLAEDVAHLARIIHRHGRVQTAMDLLPRYLRGSAAEEKLAAAKT